MLCIISTQGLLYRVGNWCYYIMGACVLCHTDAPVQVRNRHGRHYRQRDRELEWNGRDERLRGV
eukprot:5754409-Prymnesium_polylepis.1